MGNGLSPRQLGVSQDYGFGNDAVWSVPFEIDVQTVAATATYTLISSSNYRARDFRIKRAYVYCTAAPGAGDTVKLTDGTNDITDTIDLSAFSDTDQVDFSQINDAYNQIGPTESLVVTTASGALVRVSIECEWV